MKIKSFDIFQYCLILYTVSIIILVTLLYIIYVSIAHYCTKACAILYENISAVSPPPPPAPSPNLPAGSSCQTSHGHGPGGSGGWQLEPVLTASGNRKPEDYDPKLQHRWLWHSWDARRRLCRRRGPGTRPQCIQNRTRDGLVSCTIQENI